MNEMRSKLFYEIEKLDDCIEQIEKLNNEVELNQYELESIHKRISALYGLIFTIEAEYESKSIA